MVDGRTIIHLDQEAYGSVFVMFIDDTSTTTVAPVQRTRTVVAQLGTGWTVNFQAQRGAPECVALDSLTSLTESADFGVKYFSGVATYTNTIKISKKVLKKNASARIYLDLGDVHDLAEVTVNGQPIGVTWHAPYLVDITSALKAGDNKIEIAVANPWHNRMVGDVQPGAKAVTYYPMTYYKVDEPLLKSGLVGPVRIVAEQ